MRLVALQLVVVLSLGAGCAGRSVYEGLRTQQEMECNRQPGASPYECAERSGMAYDGYQHELNKRPADR